VETFNKLKSLIEEKGFYIPITGIYNYIKKYNKKKKKKVKLIWRYAGCECIPEDDYRSEPYCKLHYNPLIRIEEE